MGKHSKNIIPSLAQRLHNLAHNLWWVWNPAAQSIFKELSPLSWKISNHNPVLLLSQISQQELYARLGDEEFQPKVIEVLDTFDSYMKKKPQLFGEPNSKRNVGLVAYFCAEFGLHECLPLYSGGLGVLAGDHTKSASDLGLPFVGVGLFYRQGYFKQHVDDAGKQHEEYPSVNPQIVPVEPAMDGEGNQVKIYVEIGDHKVFAQGWQVNVGRCKIYLLDTDVEENDREIRGLTAMAYGGDTATRIRQEMVLGIGGVRLLRAMKLEPKVFHMNEGHAAFLTLEMMREQIQSGLQREKAEERVREKCIFTTHTPVPAGHDRFSREVFEFSMRPMAHSLNMNMEELWSYGQNPEPEGHHSFTMTVLALKLSRAANGVSKKHGEVSRMMWKSLYPGVELDDVPIGHVTNGVHLPSWSVDISWKFWQRHDSHQWQERLNDRQFWNNLSDPKVVSDEDLWSLRYQLRRQLVEFMRNKARNQRIHGGVFGEEAFQKLLNPDALTIGFARRFASYKRAAMLFTDIARAEKIFNTLERPIQIIFAGKAHPKDENGKAYLNQVVQITNLPQFWGKVVFIENYDMNIARHLVSGCDVWLNNPRRPMEASGTSGEKIAINGGLHASVLDGWWSEAYNGENGWAIGGTEEGLRPEDEDRLDADALYQLLLGEIIPLFYERDEKAIPRGWVARIRNAIKTIIPVYNTHRMVMEYAEKYYFPK